jgi:hypothetical protein
MTAARTEAVELKSVGLDGKSVPGGHFFLEPLNFLVFKFHDLIAAGADEVIVVALVRDVVVLRLRAEVPGLCEAGIAEQIERPVDGRESKVRIGLSQLVIHGLRGNVLLPEEGVQNQFTLACELELMLAQVLSQGLHFFHMLIRHDHVSQWTLIKDETVQLVKGGPRQRGDGEEELTEIFGALYSASSKKVERARHYRMRKPNQITVDRALLLYVLHLAEPHGLLSDVKLQQLCFLCELQIFGKGFKGFHFEFFRFAYGAFSKDLDNDLMSLRRKERVENFSLSDQAQEEVIPLLEKSIEGVETNEKVAEILKAVVTVYGPQDSGSITQSVESVELSTPQQPEFKIPIRDIVFHTTLLVPSRIEVQAEFTLSGAILGKLNQAMGY